MLPYSDSDVAAVQRIALIPSILQTVSQITGLRFTCIARVTPQGWTACAVYDELALGLQPGDTLAIGAQPAGAAPPSLGGYASFVSVPIRRQDGSSFGTLCGIDPLPSALAGTAALASMTLLAELVSQQLSSQQVLEDAQFALLDATATSELREQFIAVLGHDLRNPLGTIITGAELMLLSLGNPERLAILARLIQGSGKRMAALVDDVVDLTRGKMGGGIALTLRPENALDKVIGQVVDELRSSYPEREIHFDSGPQGEVICDAGRLGQLCSNLLKNALVYGDPQRSVSVSLRLDGAGLQLAVTNHGPAMSADTIAHLFKPYWRAPAKSPHEGLGLGLFIAGEIARAHGGKMTVSSGAELTTFLLTLDGGAPAPAPAARAEAAQG
jgi:signal transduction histidine kinase